MSTHFFTSQRGFLNREIIVAIILGFSIGLVVTYGIWTANRSLKEQEAISSPVPGTITPTNTSTDMLTNNTKAATDTTNQLTIIQPEPFTLSDTNTLTMTGMAPEGSTIIILTESGNQVLSLDDNNEFESEIKLITGINYITVFALHTDGTTERLDRTLVLSS